MSDENMNNQDLQETNPIEPGGESTSEFYPIPSDLTYDEQIRKIKNTDPINAETIVNPVLEQMITNTAFLKWKQDSISSQLSELSTDSDEMAESISDLQDGKADLNPETGKVPASQLPPLNYDPAGTATQKVSEHNGNANAHPAIQEKVATAQQTANNAATAAANAQQAANGAL